MRAKQNLTAE